MKYLTIGLLNNITDFTKEVEYLLYNLFSIKIKTLLELNLYNNIYFDNKQKLYKIIENNWIKSYYLILNNKSNFFCDEKKISEKKDLIFDDIQCLVHHKLEKEILGPYFLEEKKKYKFRKK